ncbi:MAG TPA: hypothetical protein VFZ53_25935 [Polyangiaceae bacterium]
MRIAGWVLFVLGAVVAVPALSVPLVLTFEETFLHRWRDPYHLVFGLSLYVGALGACVAGIGGLMAWVGRKTG